MVPTVESAVRACEQIRWQGHPVCPKCDKADKLTAQQQGGTSGCGMCRAYFTVFTNTPLERNKLDARKGLVAADLVLTARKGISSYPLSKEHAVQQRTAWDMMHRLRTVWATQTQSVLFSSLVERDETSVGGKEKNKQATKRTKPQGGGGIGKQAVLGMRQHDGKAVVKAVSGPDRLILWTERQKTGQKGRTLFTAAHGA